MTGSFLCRSNGPSPHRSRFHMHYPRVLVAPGSRKLSCRGAGEDPEILRASPEMLTINTRFIPHSRSRETLSSVITYISFFLSLEALHRGFLYLLVKVSLETTTSKNHNCKDGQLRFCCRGHATLTPRNNGHHKGPQVPEKLRSFGDIVCRQL